MLLRDGHRPDAGRQAVRNRLLVEVPGLLPEHVARLQQRAWQDAGCGHRRGAGEPESAGSRGVRRRRHGFDRSRAVRAYDAPQRPSRLHHRGQRLLRTDQGAVLGHGQPRLDGEVRHRQRVASDRLVRLGRSDGSDFRGALLLRRQEAAAVDLEGGTESQGHGGHRRGLSLRHVQRPRGLDQELQVRP